jgi:hypothetical protein
VPQCVATDDTNDAAATNESISTRSSCFGSSSDDTHTSDGCLYSRVVKPHSVSNGSSVGHPGEEEDGDKCSENDCNTSAGGIPSYLLASKFASVCSPCGNVGFEESGINPDFTTSGSSYFGSSADSGCQRMQLLLDGLEHCPLVDEYLSKNSSFPALLVEDDLPDVSSTSSRLLCPTDLLSDSSGSAGRCSLAQKPAQTPDSCNGQPSLDHLVVRVHDRKPENCDCCPAAICVELGNASSAMSGTNADHVLPVIDSGSSSSGSGKWLSLLKHESQHKCSNEKPHADYCTVNCYSPTDTDDDEML